MTEKYAYEFDSIDIKNMRDRARESCSWKLILSDDDHDHNFFFFSLLYCSRYSWSLLKRLIITRQKKHQYQIFKDHESSRLCRATDVNYPVSRSWILLLYADHFWDTCRISAVSWTEENTSDAHDQEDYGLSTEYFTRKKLLTSLSPSVWHNVELDRLVITLALILSLSLLTRFWYWMYLMTLLVEKILIQVIDSERLVLSIRRDVRVVVRITNRASLSDRRVFRALRGSFVLIILTMLFSNSLHDWYLRVIGKKHVSLYQFQWADRNFRIHFWEEISFRLALNQLDFYFDHQRTRSIRVISNPMSLYLDFDAYAVHCCYKKSH